MGGSKSGIIKGLFLLGIIVIVWPFVMPVVEDISALVISTSNMTSADGMEYLIFYTMPWWGLAIGVGTAIWMIVGGARNRRF